MQQQPQHVPPGAPQPIPNYVGYWRRTSDGQHTEHLLARNGIIVGHWVGSPRLDLPTQVAPLVGQHITAQQGFTLAHRDVTTVLLQSYRESKQRGRSSIPR